jgi:high-affinity Fe2+/Pb2+ permease
MLFRKRLLFSKRKPRSAVTVALIACATFLALAVYGWDVPLSDLSSFLIITVGLLAAIIGAAFLMVILIKSIKRLMHRGDSDD